MNEPANRTVTNLRKSGDLKGAWEFGFQALENAPQNTYLKGALFWVCYEYIKQYQDKIAKRGASSKNYRPSDYEFEQIERLLSIIISFELPLGGLEYKMLLVQFKKNLKWFPTLIHFVLSHQAALFDEEAKTPFQAEKGEMPSLMLSSARQVASAWLSCRELWRIELALVIDFINVTREQVGDNKNMMWLDYDQAKCLIADGQYEQARTLLLPILRKKQQESWAWAALAASYTKTDRALAMKFFAKGIVSAREDVYSLKLFIGIVPLLLECQRQQEASMCVKTALGVYQQHGWRIKPELEHLSQQAWYDASVNEKSLKDYLRSLAANALDYLHGPMDKVVSIIESIHKSGKGFQVFVNKSTSFPVRMGIYKGKRPQVGDYVYLSISAASGEREVVACSPCPPCQIADVSDIEGHLRIAPKGFGFVEDTFVPAFLVGEIANESKVSALRIMSWNKSKSRYDWKAIKLTLI
ncbi:DUF7017 domain-containing protein [Shewanella algae]|uniref:DUF7017 domain-containing protein n=1 Tax=Shewanella algae TaxID=38313 RepID=UPI001183BE8D|nr:tetratricopeptide repeat protein [Shewanella algae]TVL33704.1 hypothetical protein AYI94_16810 [Shewanella algae]